MQRLQLRPFTRWLQRPRTDGNRRPAVARRRTPLSHRFSTRLQNSRYTDASGPGQTLTSLCHLAAAPCWVRLIYFNDRDTPWAINGAAVASTSALSDDHTPLNASGRPDLSLWQRVTFNNAGLDVEPLAPTEGSEYALTIPANPREQGRPVMVFSDWMPLAAQPRLDSGSSSLLLVRTYSDGLVRYAGSVGLPDQTIGRLHAGSWATGNQTIPPWTAPQNPDATIFACHGVQYISPALGATIIGIGDSIMHSTCTTGELSGFGIRACAMVSSPQLPIDFFNEGYPGRNSLGFCFCGVWGIEHLQPQIALIQTWSQNEPWTQDTADLSFARAIAVADVARRNHCVPILVTAAPVFAANPVEEAYRCSNVARVRAAAERGTNILDVDALWGTGASPNAYRPEFSAGDQMHPNDAGCAAAAEVLASILREILASG